MAKKQSKKKRQQAAEEKILKQFIGYCSTFSVHPFKLIEKRDPFKQCDYCHVPCDLGDLGDVDTLIKGFLHGESEEAL